MGDIDLSVIVVSYNVKELLRACIRSVYASTDRLRLEVVVVDNGSADGTVPAVIEEFPALRLLANPANAGFAMASNQALHKVSGRHVLLLNPDTIVSRSALDRLLECLGEHPEAAVIAPRLVNPDGSAQPSVGRFPSVAHNLRIAFGAAQQLEPSQPKAALSRTACVDYVIGACMLLRPDALTDGLLFDPSFFMYGEDKDLCLRMTRQGWRVYYCPDAQVVHYGGQSSALQPLENLLRLQESQIRFYRKHNRRVRYVLLAASWLLVRLNCAVYYSIAGLLDRRKHEMAGRFWRAYAHTMRCIWQLR